MNENKVVATTQRCALYARKREGSSSPSAKVQIDNGKTEAHQMGWDLADQYIFTDKGLAGTAAMEDRPGLIALLAEARKTPRPVDVVVVNDVKCFSRKVEDILNVYSRLSQLGITVHVCKSPLRPVG